MPPIDELNMDVTAVPWVPEDMLPHLYSRAAVFVYPSFLEVPPLPPKTVVVCCIVLQCFAVCCSVLQRVAA